MWTKIFQPDYIRRENIYWTTSGLQYDLWTDETNIELLRDKQQSLLWRCPYEGFRSSSIHSYKTCAFAAKANMSNGYILLVSCGDIQSKFSQYQKPSSMPSSHIEVLRSLRSGHDFLFLKLIADSKLFWNM